MSDLLLVDNDRRIVELVAFFLEKRGHVVRRADSYAAARTALAERVPDLMLADLELGLERGEEELPRLSREGLLPLTLIVSGYLEAATERDLCALRGVVGALRKPFDLAQLEQRIRLALETASPRAVHAQGPPPRATRSDDGWVDVRPFEAQP